MFAWQSVGRRLLKCGELHTGTQCMLERERLSLPEQGWRRSAIVSDEKQAGNIKNSYAR